MGLKDRDYMKRNEQHETIKKLEQLKYFQQQKKTSFLKMILISLMLLGGIFIIMQYIIDAENIRLFNKGTGLIGIPILFYFGNKLRKIQWKP